MNQTQEMGASIFPERMRVLSGSALKILAVVLMMIDHTAVHILSKIPAAKDVPVFALGGYHASWYRFSRDLGRMAFPIFCFLIVEGFLHTRNRFRYGRNLLLFALVSEIPWNYVHSGTWTYAKQNVYFTLFLGFLGMCVLERFREQQFAAVVMLGMLLYIAVKLNADYGYRGFLFLVILYLLREQRAAQAVVGGCWLAYEWKACFAFLPINLYNGKRGFVRGAVWKYCFYAFYPVHLMVLAYVKFYLM